MGKKDRAAEIAKQSKKKPEELKNPKSKQQQFEETLNRRELEREEKKKADQKAAEVARQEQEETRVAALKAGRAPIGGARMGGAQTFAKARQQQPQEVSGSESDVSEAEAAPEAFPESPEDSAVETRKGKKKGKKTKLSMKDEWEVAQSENAKERNARIVQRIKNMLLIGFFEKKTETSATGGAAADSRKKSGKKKPTESKGVATTVRDFKPLLYTAGIVLLLLALKLGEEGYDPYNQRDENEANPYTLLDISSSASPADIKKAYKDLALKWHPDKNPDCETCEKHFGDIGKAYELLSNPSRRQSYDNKRRESNKLESAFSIPLNRDDYEKKVLRSNDVWILNLHNSDQSASMSAYAIWEDLAQKGQHYFKFGHIDAAGEGASILPLLRVRKGMYPVFLRVARGFSTEVSPISETETSKKLTRWAVDSFPDIVPTLYDSSAYEAFKVQKLGANKLGRIVFCVMDDGDVKKNQLAFLRIAFLYKSFFDFAMIQREHAPKSMTGTHASAAVMMYIDEEGKEHRTATDTVKDTSDFEVSLGEIFRNHAPAVDQTTYHEICGSKHVRKYCLALVDPSPELVAQTLAELKEARAAHDAEQKELEGGEDYVKVEPPNIQMISIMTSPSIFSHDFPVSRSFSSWHYQEGILGASKFLLEESTDRARGLDNYKDTSEWYQMLELEDLTLREVGSVRPHLADPLLTVQEDLHQVFLGTIWRMAAFFLFAVVVAALIPEMTKEQALGFFSVVVPVIVFTASYALRKSIALIFV